MVGVNIGFSARNVIRTERGKEILLGGIRSGLAGPEQVYAGVGLPGIFQPTRLPAAISCWSFCRSCS